MKRWMQRPWADDRLDQELRDHVERLVADYVAAGQTEEEGRRRARIELGGLEQAKERCRDVRRWHWLDEAVRDVRVGFRALARERLFSLAVTLILAVGIGTGVAMFSLLQAVVLRPLPYDQPDRLAVVTTQLLKQNQPDGSSMPTLEDWRRQSRSFAAFTFYRRTSVSAVTYAGVDAPQRAQEGLVGPEFFDVLGTPPLVGRTFGASEFDRREAVVVLSEAVWQDQFARSPAAIGRTLTIDGVGHTVIGVMPAAFQLPTRDTRFWRPLSTQSSWESSRHARDGDGFEVIGRLAPGVDLDTARTEMSSIAARLRQAYPENANLDARVLPLFDHVVAAATTRGVWLGFGAVLSLLAIACANVGGLLTVRAARRRRELAVRAALGAGRLRLGRQLLAETASLWTVASGAGLALAWGLIRLLVAYGPAFPRLENVALDATAVALALAGGFVVIAACGAIPALVASRTDAAAAFATRHASGLPRHRFLDALVTGQIAGAMLLLVVAVLFGRSFLRALEEDPGYRPETLVIVRLDLPRVAYPDAAALASFFREARDRVARLPGVVAVGAMTDFFIRRNADQRVTVEGVVEPEDRVARLSIESVTPGYFAAAGIALLEGREFDDRDLQPGATRVFVVNETLARRFWPGESAVGKRMVAGSHPRADGRWNTVVGVVRDMRREGLDRTPIASAFEASYMRGMDMTLRAGSGAETLIPAVRRELRAIDPALPVTQIATADSRIAERLSGRRFETQALSLFALIAVALSAAGLYASLAYQVAIRTREIGIRSAVGAGQRSIVTLILEQGLRRGLVGVGLGIAGAAGAGGVVQSLLYETAAIDVRVYATAILVLLLVIASAAALPAARAARVSPVTALRED